MRLRRPRRPINDVTPVSYQVSIRPTWKSDSLHWQWNVRWKDANGNVYGTILQGLGISSSKEEAEVAAHAFIAANRITRRQQAIRAQRVADEQIVFEVPYDD